MTPQPPPCIYLIDDDDAVREGLEMVIETIGMTCRTFANAESFLKSFIPGRPGCLVLDMNMPGMDGDELQAELNRRNIHIPIIFLTSFGDIPMSVRAIKAGAVDFLTKPVQINQLLERIQAELQHEIQRYGQEQCAKDFLCRIKSLTRREMDILPLALAGVVNKEIAQQLGISFRTVEIHRGQILKKTGAANFLELSRKCEASQITFEPKSDDTPLLGKTDG